jgi:MFS family permease
MENHQEVTEDPAKGNHADADPAPIHRRFGALWTNTDFLKFWAGETVSLFGAQVSILGLPLAAILVLHAGPEQVGVLRALQLLPYLFLALLFGILADRRGRRPLMIIANGARAVLIGLVPILAAVHQLRISLLYVIALFVGAGAVLYDVCWQSYVPAIISDRQQMLEANSKLGTSSSAADVTGPGLTGALVQALTAPYALAANAVTYGLSVISLLTIRTRETVLNVPSEQRNLFQSAREGLSWVFGNRYLRALALLGGSYNFFFTFIETDFLVYATRSLSMRPSAIGLVLSIGGIGGLIGAMLGSILSNRFGVGVVYSAGVLVGFAAPILIPLASGPRLAVLATLSCSFFLTGIGIGSANVIVLSLRQSITPPQLMGRMNATMRMLVYGLAAPGSITGGLLADSLGLRAALWVAGICSILAVAPLFRSGIPRLKVLPGPAMV